eukprot:2559882-Ditylum_brightwellii.AAC.1
MEHDNNNNNNNNNNDEDENKIYNLSTWCKRILESAGVAVSSTRTNNEDNNNEEEEEEEIIQRLEKLLDVSLPLPPNQNEQEEEEQDIMYWNPTDGTTYQQSHTSHSDKQLDDEDDVSLLEECRPFSPNFYRTIGQMIVSICSPTPPSSSATNNHHTTKKENDNMGYYWPVKDHTVIRCLSILHALFHMNVIMNNEDSASDNNIIVVSSCIDFANVGTIFTFSCITYDFNNNNILFQAFNMYSTYLFFFLYQG